jgi:peroxiredoxin
MLPETTVKALAEAFRRSRELDAALPERLENYSKTVRQYLPDYAAATDRIAAQIAAADFGASTPAPGDAMPPFLLPDHRGELVALDDLLQDGPVAITFHRGHWCPWCRISAHALARAIEGQPKEFGRVAAIMPDRQKFAAAFRTEAEAPFPVLIDLDNSYALDLGLAIWIGDELVQLLTSFGRNLPEFHGNDAWMMPVPATFVVRKDGIIAARFMDPDFRRREAVENLLAALRAAG